MHMEIWEKKKPKTKQAPKHNQKTTILRDERNPLIDKPLPCLCLIRPSTILKEKALISQLFRLHSFLSSLNLLTAQEIVIHGEKTSYTTAFRINRWIFLKVKSEFWGTFFDLKFPRITNIPVAYLLHC